MCKYAISVPASVLTDSGALDSKHKQMKTFDMADMFSLYMAALREPMLAQHINRFTFLYFPKQRPVPGHVSISSLQFSGIVYSYIHMIYWVG